MAANINRVVLVGNLTRDPELRHTPSGTAVCSLRLAVNSRRKDASTGEWGEKPNYFDITVWGNQGESCAQYLSKGRPVAVDGRLDWREYEAKDGSKRQAIEITEWHSNERSRAAERAGARPSRPVRSGGRAVTSARRRSKRSTTRTTTSCVATCPRRARSARGGSPERAGV